MRYLWLLPLLLLSGCYYPYGPSYGYGYPYPYYPSYGYAPSYYGSGPPPPSYHSQQSYPALNSPITAACSRVMAIRPPTTPTTAGHPTNPGRAPEGIADRCS